MDMKRVCDFYINQYILYKIYGYVQNYSTRTNIEFNQIIK